MKNLESQPQEEHPIWPVSFDKEGNLCGLPEGVPREKVILFLGNSGQWLAQNPSPETLREIGMWRTDWMK